MGGPLVRGSPTAPMLAEIRKTLWINVIAFVKTHILQIFVIQFVQKQSNRKYLVFLIDDPNFLCINEFGVKFCTTLMYHLLKYSHKTVQLKTEFNIALLRLYKHQKQQNYSLRENSLISSSVWRHNFTIYETLKSTFFT